MKKLAMPPIERKWVKCPYCGAKVMLYDNTAQCSGVFITCYRGDGLEHESPENRDSDTDEIRRPPVISWKKEAKYIIGDFLRYYRIDLMTAEMHW